MGFLTGEIVSVILFFIGFYGIITKKRIFKAIISIVLMEAATVIFFLSIGYGSGGLPPIGAGLENAVDPLPQALVITAIIIGAAVTAINITMFISLYRQHGIKHWPEEGK